MCVQAMNLEDGRVIPCGKCYVCLKRKISGWCFRLTEEEKYHQDSLFITLTYDTKNVPFTRAGQMSLHKRDVQLFLKRLRKANSQGNATRSIKYFAVGEYGGFTRRPHYHLILFGAKIETIASAWGLGHVHYGFVSGASITYTLKYMFKRPVKHKRSDRREKEFRIMSKGLGVGYTQKRNIIKWHKSKLDERMYLNLPGNVKIAMPRYYKDKIYSDEEREECSIYALKRNKVLQEQDTRTMEEKRQAVLQSFIALDLERISRCKV